MVFKVVIIGGGLAGSLLANGLLNNEVAVTVYERDSEDSKREGYQIRLGESALVGFRACLDDKHRRSIIGKFGQSSGSSSTAPTIYTTQFKPVLDLKTLPNYSKSWAINRVVLRNLLIQPVKERGHVRFNKTYSHSDIIFNAKGQEQVRAHFTDDTYDDCDILVAADGSSSRVNKDAGLDNLVQLNSHQAFLAKGSLTPDRINLLPPQLQKGPIIVFAKKATFFYSLYVPADTGGRTKSNQGIIYNEQEASFYWGLHIPTTAIPEPPSGKSNRQICLDFVHDWAPEYQTLLATGADDKTTPDIYRAPLRASKRPSKNWRSTRQKANHPTSSKGHPRVWFIGDAIHAMQPNRGQGGNQALHDCADILPELLSLNALSKQGAQPTREQVQAACDRYEDVMIDRAFGWVRKSGGSTIKEIDFDGILGTLLSIIGGAAVFLYAIFLRLVPGSRK